MKRIKIIMILLLLFFIQFLYYSVSQLYIGMFASGTMCLALMFLNALIIDTIKK